MMSVSTLSADDQIDIETLRSRAAGGDVKAQVDLAHCYRDGKGVAKDSAQAHQWAHRAADGGQADAMDFVGSAYLRGAAIKGNPGISPMAYFHDRHS